MYCLQYWKKFHDFTFNVLVSFPGQSQHEYEFSSQASGHRAQTCQYKKNNVTKKCSTYRWVDRFSIRQIFIFKLILFFFVAEISGRPMVVMRPASGQVVCSPGRQVLQLRQSTNVSQAKTGVVQGKFVHVLSCPNSFSVLNCLWISFSDAISGSDQKPPRYISLQQAKQMGLVTGGKLNQVSWFSNPY